jgi:DNA polymerase phi
LTASWNLRRAEIITDSLLPESLFASSSSAERKYHGFQVFSKALARADQASVPYLFTPNFMRCFINHLASTDRYLHRIARSVAFEIQNIVQKTPALGMALLTQLTGEHGSRQFDRLTKTKTVESILGAMDTEGITKYIHHLLAQVNPTSGEYVVFIRATVLRTGTDRVSEKMLL